jgi:hypothetical protein
MGRNKKKVQQHPLEDSSSPLLDDGSASSAVADHHDNNDRHGDPYGRSSSTQSVLASGGSWPTLGETMTGTLSSSSSDDFIMAEAGPGLASRESFPTTLETEMTGTSASSSPSGEMIMADGGQVGRFNYESFPDSDEFPQPRDEDMTVDHHGQDQASSSPRITDPVITSVRDGGSNAMKVIAAPVSFLVLFSWFGLGKMCRTFWTDLTVLQYVYHFLFSLFSL